MCHKTCAAQLPLASYGSGSLPAAPAMAALTQGATRRLYGCVALKHARRRCAGAVALTRRCGASMLLPMQAVGSDRSIVCADGLIEYVML